MPVLDRERTRTRTGRIWTYVGDRNRPYIVYDYTGNHSREGPEEFLKGYKGYLQADAYRAYDAMFKNRKQNLTEVACWAHSRRYFFEAQTSDLCRATVMLAYIQLLYEVEREARQGNLSPEQRRELRQTKSRPILEDIKNYLQTEKPKVLPKSAIGEAIDYTLSNWEALLRYTEDGELEIDNNNAERSLRPIVVGRNNWLFYGSDKGGRTGAVLSSLIASCKRLRVEPFGYLRDLFARISDKSRCIERPSARRFSDAGGTRQRIEERCRTTGRENDDLIVAGVRYIDCARDRTRGGRGTNCIGVRHGRRCCDCDTQARHRDTWH